MNEKEIRAGIWLLSEAFRYQSMLVTSGTSAYLLLSRPGDLLGCGSRCNQGQYLPSKNISRSPESLSFLRFPHLRTPHVCGEA